MNKLINYVVIAILVPVILLPITGFSQKKEKRVKTVKVIDGKKIVTDSVFLVNGDEKEITETMSWVFDSDSVGSMTMDIDADIDTESGKRISVVTTSSNGNDFTSHGDKEMKYVIKIDEDNEGEHKVVVIEDENEMILYGDEIRMLHGEIEEHMAELKTISIELDGGKIIMLNELAELENIMELSELSELENIIIDKHEAPEFHGYHNFEFHDRHSNVITDKELRDAGIKNKVDRLNVSKININIDNGVVDLEFKLASDGTPKIIVYNYFGDKVFNGKPELMGGEYSIKIDLSKKQRGTYYLQIIKKDASLTEKLRL